MEMRADRWTIPVTLSDGTTYHMACWLYYSGTLSDRPLQVALHGATYDHRYWDFPSVGGQDYSYAKYMVEKGYAVLAVDQLGCGESDKPDGDFLNLAEHSSSVNQLLALVRSGSNPSSQAFSKIILVGHSLGSSTAIHAQASAGRADLLVVTGMSHVPHLIPIPLDVVLAALSAPYGGLSEPPRSSLFYAQGDADPAVIAQDQQMFSSLVARGMLLTAFLQIFDPSVTLVGRVQGNVLVQLSEKDVLFPSTDAEAEMACWTMAPKVKVRTVPTVGHCFNLHRDRQRGWQRIDEFIKEHQG